MRLQSWLNHVGIFILAVTCKFIIVLLQQVTYIQVLGFIRLQWLSKEMLFMGTQRGNLVFRKTFNFGRYPLDLANSEGPIIHSLSVLRHTLCPDYLEWSHIIVAFK